ncbi:MULTISPECIES: class I SAM-dependent methyltransferase [Streptomyces]|uniref:Methyltransferase domain-containing protein n=1 Tax=Streptomyces olivaceus TaxID=47716 RepID=A0ABS7WFU0_STROV|nr:MULTISPECIES: methyltransferase domain-containing protein [Streptomyces]MBZ6093237.1 methyltransferase domain-containing protein [Streptomyces olivaceus]MBZ6100256.1 methyltransferase domain-containing protein [Streptomyces olivaceus]MBZ6107472.1 methyltransferase domain-containing protein [Streptomyces olivaceus]MBZ6114284.1 methyltransferase domain-containing protein [Streptomyces olivaceus]MBZ6121322.1 methyltransferase domain-containing protein [Streptomyces olivaceus]
MTDSGSAIDNAVFDERLANFQKWQETPWGQLRYSVVAANLDRHLDDRPLRVLDVAGGNGREAVRLAARGHHVTVLDVAPVSLAGARDIAAEHGVAGLVEVREGDAHDVADLFAGQAFDLMLCHNLLQYVPDPAVVVGGIVKCLKPGGLLSVVGPNAYAVPLEAAVRELDLATARSAVDARYKPNVVYGKDVPVLTSDEIGGHLGGAGLDVVGHYGVMNVCNLVADNDIKYDPDFFGRLEELEIALAGRMPYPLTARMFHLIAQRPR